MSAPELSPTAALGYLQMTMTVHEWNADTADHVRTLLAQAGFPIFELADNQQITIEHDEEYEPYGDYDLEEERRQLASGEWMAYTVILAHQCDCGNWVADASLSGVVVQGSSWEGSYGVIDMITDTYLRATACELLSEES